MIKITIVRGEIIGSGIYRYNTQVLYWWYYTKSFILSYIDRKLIFKYNIVHTTFSARIIYFPTINNKHR